MKFLNEPKDFIINKIVKPKYILKNLKKLKKADQWKLVNLETFLSRSF